jgi:hypothetical protein
MEFGLRETMVCLVIVRGFTDADHPLPLHTRHLKFGEDAVQSRAFPGADSTPHHFAHKQSLRHVPGNSVKA